MEIMRSILSWLSLYLVGTCFFITANFFVLFNVLNADTVKDTLHEQKVYNSIVPAIVLTASSGQTAAGQLPLQEPWVQDAANKAFPPADLEQKTGTIVDATFTWLEGKTEKPEFRIDLTPNKQQLGVEVANYAQKRLENLPACTLSNLPDTFDPYTIECLPPGFSASSLAATVGQQVRDDPGFLPNPVITSETLTLNPANTVKGSNPLQGLDGVRSVYQKKTLLMVVPIIFTVAFAVIGLLLTHNRAKGFRRLSRSFLVSAITLFVLAFGLGFGLQRLLVDLATTSKDAVSRDIISPLLTGLIHQVQMVYYIFAGIALVVTLATFIASRTITRKA